MVVVQFSPAIPCNQHDVPLARFAMVVLGLDLSFLRNMNTDQSLPLGSTVSTLASNRVILRECILIDKLLPCYVFGREVWK